MRQAGANPRGGGERDEEQAEERRGVADLREQAVDRRPAGKEAQDPADRVALVPEVPLLIARPRGLPRQIEARQEQEPACEQKQDGPGPLGAEATPDQLRAP